MAELTISPENDSLKEPELVSINTPTPLSHNPGNSTPHIYVVHVTGNCLSTCKQQDWQTKWAEHQGCWLYIWEH